MQYEKMKPGYLLITKVPGPVVVVLRDGPEPDTYVVRIHWDDEAPEQTLHFDEFKEHYLGAV